MAGKRGDHPDDARIKDCVKRAGVENAQQLADKAGISATLLHTRLANTESSRISIPVWEKIEAVCSPSQARLAGLSIDEVIRVPVIQRHQLEAWLEMRKSGNVPTPLETIAIDQPNSEEFELVACVVDPSYSNARFRQRFTAIVAIDDIILVDGEVYMIRLTPATLAIHKSPHYQGSVVARTWFESKKKFVAEWADLPDIDPIETTEIVGRVVKYVIKPSDR